MGRKLKTTREECSAIKSWLKVPGNSQAILASTLGLKSSTAISQWLGRGRVSKWYIEKVREMFNVTTKTSN